MLKRKNVGKIGAAAVLLTLSLSFASYAGEWRQEGEAWYYTEGQDNVTGWQQIGETWYYFDQDGKMETGWIRENNTWYYLDEESGAWVERPSINRISACYLLENAVNKAGLYQHEDYPLVFNVETENSDSVKVRIQTEELPERYKTINSYEVSRKTGIARATVGDDLNLWQY